MFVLGCKFTWDYFLIGAAGSLVAVLVLPGSYMTLPCIKRVDGELRICWGALARIIVGGIVGCVVDCNGRNVFFGGFFSWHMLRWLSEDGWNILREKLRLICRLVG